MDSEDANDTLDAAVDALLRRRAAAAPLADALTRLAPSTPLTPSSPPTSLRYTGSTPALHDALAAARTHNDALAALLNDHARALATLTAALTATTASTLTTPDTARVDAAAAAMWDEWFASNK